MFRIFLLKPGDDRSAFVAQGAGFVQFRVKPGGDESAVAGQQGRFGDKGLDQANSAGHRNLSGFAAPCQEDR